MEYKKKYKDWKERQRIVVAVPMVDLPLPDSPTNLQLKEQRKTKSVLACVSDMILCWIVHVRHYLRHGLARFDVDA